MIFLFFSLIKCVLRSTQFVDMGDLPLAVQQACYQLTHIGSVPSLESVDYNNVNYFKREGHGIHPKLLTFFFLSSISFGQEKEMPQGD